MTVQFDFTSQDFLRDPAARLERLRAFGPVVEVRFPIIIGKTWITTTQEAADLMLKESRTFTLRREGGEESAHLAYEWGHSRHPRHRGVSGSPQERPFGQCPRL